MNKTYHTELKIAYQLGLLPASLRREIPSSTLYNWSKHDFSHVFGCDDAHILAERVRVLKNAASNERLYAMVRTLVRVNSVFRKTLLGIRGGFRNLAGQRTQIIKIFERAAPVLKAGLLLRSLGLTRQQLAYWKRESRTCPSSLMELCRRRHPHQLTNDETNVIRARLNEQTTSHWPLRSIYYDILRRGEACFSLSTFYHYARRLGLTRKRPDKKKHELGIRASGPQEILHADVTLTRLSDETRVYIYVLIDNFSRSVRGIRVETELSAVICRENIEASLEERHDAREITLVVDGGSENKGAVDEMIDERRKLIRKLVAQRDITFSNSMAEAMNRILKGQYIRDRKFKTLDALRDFVQLSAKEYNDRPHGSLYGLTPNEAFSGVDVDKHRFKRDIIVARANRTTLNRKFDCRRCATEI